MRRFVVLLLLALMACASPKSPASCGQHVCPSELVDKTVALLQIDEEGVRPYCTGVWVGPKTIVTAAHCVEDTNSVMFGMRSDVLEANGDERKFPTIREGEVVAVDEAHDLAVIRATGHKLKAELAPAGQADAGQADAGQGTTGQGASNELEPRYRESVDAKRSHGVAVLAANEGPKVGESVATMGHPMGLWWSYSRGDVAAIRSIDESKTIYVQTTAPTSRGNSGGGLYNDKGELVGIAHAAIFSGVNLAFYVHVSHVRALLNKVGVS